MVKNIKVIIINRSFLSKQGIDELNCFTVCQFGLVQQRKTLLDFRKCKVLQLGLPLEQENLTTSPPH